MAAALTQRRCYSLIAILDFSLRRALGLPCLWQMLSYVHELSYKPMICSSPSSPLRVNSFYLFNFMSTSTAFYIMTTFFYIFRQNVTSSARDSGDGGPSLPDLMPRAPRAGRQQRRGAAEVPATTGRRLPHGQTLKAVQRGGEEKRWVACLMDIYLSICLYIYIYNIYIYILYIYIYIYIYIYYIYI